jgi:spermidine/putrescine transport system substrate-binding protein
MTETLTREEAVRRLLVGGAILTVPGLAPALAEAMAGADPRLAKTLTISNWPYYIDTNDKTGKRPSLELFQKRYGVKVKYIEDIGANATFFGKIQAQLRSGQSTGRDIVVLTDNEPYPALMIKEGWVEKLVKSKIPNLKNLQPVQRHPAWDPKRDYSLPWQSYMTGIAYNKKRTKPIASIDQLLGDKKLHGKVSMLDAMPDSIGCVMLANGDDPAKVTDATFNKALKRIETAYKSGQIRKFTDNSYTGPLAKGDFWACLSWSGDIVQLQPSNPNLRWVIPTAGGLLGTDNMLVPKKGDAYTASVFMNFVYDPKIQAMIEGGSKGVIGISYVCPVLGTKQVLAKTQPAQARNPLIFPPPSTISRIHLWDPNALFNADYKEKWQRLLGA